MDENYKYETANTKRKVLILCPHPSCKGGVADYYRIVRKHFYSDTISIEYYYTGTDKHNKNRLLKSLIDLIHLLKIIKKMDLVVLNPSLDPRAVIRDGVYHFVAKRIFDKKTLVLFHGWVPGFEQLIERYARRLFRYIFSFDMVMVLASQFKNTLIRWGFDSTIIKVETTIYEHHEFKICKDCFNLLFLARFTKGKGCLEAIQTAEIIAEEFPNIKLYMAGEGELADELKNYVIKHHLENNVEFTGWVDGDEKYHLISRCGIMILPSYSEGMPIVLLEAMGVGLALVTRPVGGIPDIVEDGVNGYLVQSLDPLDFAHKVKYLLLNNNVWQVMSIRNMQKAKEKFEAKNVVKRLELIYSEVMQ